VALDTYQDIWNRVLLRAPSCSPKLAQDFVRNAFRRVAETRRWSWLVKFGQFIAPNAYNTGTVTTVQNSPIVTGTNTVWTSSMAGLQFRVGLTAPIYTIVSVESNTSLTLDNNFGGIDATGASYAIYQCYFIAPTDFHQFITVWDPAFNWQLFLDIEQREINIWDAQRASTGNAYLVSFHDYSAEYGGTVENAVNDGVGADPVATGTYTGPADATFIIECLLGGGSGTATFQWKKNEGSFNGPIVTSTTNIDLQDGVQVYWPDDVTYTAGDIWSVCVQALVNGGLPRYEFWPHQQSNHVYPFLYEIRHDDLSDTNATLPRYIRGDVLLEFALAELALWPGPSLDKPNPYRDVNLWKAHTAKAESMLAILERQDDEVWQQDLSYAYPGMAWAMASPLGDARWLQSHAI